MTRKTKVAEVTVVNKSNKIKIYFFFDQHTIVHTKDPNIITFSSKQ
jgi:hypothetical protein